MFSVLEDAMSVENDSIDFEENTQSFFSYEHEEMPSVSSKEDIRRKLKDDVEEFLKAGGRVSYIQMGVISDPPKKPESNYGRRPI